LIALSPVVSAAQYQSVFSKAGNFIMDFASLKFLDNDADKLAAFMRICVWILIFTIVYAATKLLQGGGTGTPFFTHGMGMVVAAIFATMGSFFIPPGLLIGIGEAYSTIFSAALIGIIVLAVWWLLYQSGIKNMSNARGRAGIRIVVLLLVLLLLDMITGYITGVFT
jgi:hypothetical protein